MKKIILFLLLFPSLLFAAEKEYYHTKINNADVYITSLKSFPRDNSILIIDNEAAKYSKEIFPNGKYTTNTNIVIIKKLNMIIFLKKLMINQQKLQKNYLLHIKIT